MQRWKSSLYFDNDRGVKPIGGVFSSIPVIRARLHLLKHLLVPDLAQFPNHQPQAIILRLLLHILNRFHIVNQSIFNAFHFIHPTPVQLPTILANLTR